MSFVHISASDLVTQNLLLTAMLNFEAAKKQQIIPTPKTSSSTTFIEDIALLAAVQLQLSPLASLANFGRVRKNVSKIPILALVLPTLAHLLSLCSNLA